MKKGLVMFVILLSNIFLNAQTRMEENTLITKTGFKITVGQDINIGTGSTPDGDFKFIRRNSSGLGTLLLTTNDNSHNKSQLSLTRNMAGHKGNVVKIATRGNDKIGVTYEPLITFGNGSGKYEIDIDNAIASGEVIATDDHKSKVKEKEGESKQQVSATDELTKLKKLLDNGALTKEEYNTLKKKILEKK